MLGLLCGVCGAAAAPQTTSGAATQPNAGLMFTLWDCGLPCSAVDHIWRGDADVMLGWISVCEVVACPAAPRTISDAATQT